MKLHRTRSCTAAITALILWIGGCASCDQVPLTLRRGDTALVYAPFIDRTLYFGRPPGPSAIYISPDALMPDQYVFRGGSYSWLAPQSAMRNEKGRVWPPEAAMERGPMTIQSLGTSGVSVRGPELVGGIRQSKTFAVTGPGEARLDITLHSAGPRIAPVSIWSFTAASPGSVIAVPGGPVRFADVRMQAGWERNVRVEGRWYVIDSAKIDMPTKVFVDSQPVAAAWSKGQWLVRVGDDATSPRHPEDAPVEIFINRDQATVELELIGPYRPVDAKGGNAWSETWRIVESATADISVLSGFLSEENQ